MGRQVSLSAFLVTEKTFCIYLSNDVNQLTKEALYSGLYILSAQFIDQFTLLDSTKCKRYIYGEAK